MPETSDTTQPTTQPQNQVPTTSSDVERSSGETTAYATKGDVEGLAEKQKSDNTLLLIIMASVVIFVVVTFWLELSSMHRNYQQDKSLMLQNNQLNKDYFDKILFLNNEVQDMQNELDNSRSNVEAIKTCVRSFGFTSRCFQ